MLLITNNNKPWSTESIQFYTQWLNQKNVRTKQSQIDSGRIDWIPRYTRTYHKPKLGQKIKKQQQQKVVELKKQQGWSKGKRFKQKSGLKRSKNSIQQIT